MRQSRLWFWREALTAIVFRAFQPRDREHPLGLLEASGSIPAERAPKVEQPRRVNLTASPLPGVGGLGLVAFGVIAALAGVDVLWIFLPAMVGGAAIGLILALRRGRAALAGSGEANRILPHGLYDGHHPD